MNPRVAKLVLTLVATVCSSLSTVLLTTIPLTINHALWAAGLGSVSGVLLGTAWFEQPGTAERIRKASSYPPPHT